MVGRWAGLESSWALVMFYTALKCARFYLWQSMLAFLVSWS